MKKTLLFLAILLGFAGIRAQIPADVTDVMNRCRAAMSNASGLEYEMDMKAGMSLVSVKMHLVVANKGDMNRVTTTTTILGIEVVTESGFDGTESWEVKHSTKNDTIIITKGNPKEKGDDYLILDYDKQYNKAKMKLKDGYYVITFSNPKDKSSEVKSVTVKISSKGYTLREIRSGARGAKVTMTITKIRVGLKDSYFKLNPAKYPNAAIIRK